MPTHPNKQTFRHVFGGGWATDYGENAEVGLSQDGLVRIPFLTKCLNNYYELDGGPHKIGGTTRVNSAQVESGEEFIGLYDYWKGAGGASATQKLVGHIGTKFVAADMDGNFADKKTGLTDDVVPSYTTFDDLLIISSDSTDGMFSWDQTTFQALDASAPAAAFCEIHKGRAWAAGVAAAPSTLYYSVYNDPEDWSSSGSGSIAIDPNDGDGITGLASHKNDLWVFKGPYKGSIHRIVGSAPTGGDAFGRQTWLRGLGAVWHNTIFRYRDDLGFMWSDGSVHSLAATSAYGDFNEAALSRPINGWLRSSITANRLKYSWAATDSVRGYVLFTIPIDTSTTNNCHLLMDYRFDPVRWARWDSFSSGCVATVVDSNIPTIFGGTNDGYVRRLQQTTRNIDGTTAIQAETDTPFLNYGTPERMKSIYRAAVGISPKGTYDLTFGWRRDNNAEQTTTVGQGATGGTLPFTLGTDTLGGTTDFQHRFMSLEEGGEFRDISYSVRNADTDEDLELHTILASIAFGAESGENA
jgi:hypothetical protein